MSQGDGHCEIIIGHEFILETPVSRATLAIRRAAAGVRRRLRGTSDAGFENARTRSASSHAKTATMELEVLHQRPVRLEQKRDEHQPRRTRMMNGSSV